MNDDFRPQESIFQLLSEKAELQKQLEIYERLAQEQSRKLDRILDELSERTRRLETSEKALINQRTTLESIIHSIADGIIVADENGRFLLFNKGAEQILGMGLTDTLPEEWPLKYGLYHSDGETLFRSEELPLVRAMKGENVDNVEMLIRNESRPEGLWLSINSRPLRDEKGNIRGGVVIFRDVTGHKLHDDEVRQAADYLDKIINSLADPIFVKDRQHRWVLLNDACCKFMGHPRETLLGKSDYEFFPKQEADVFWAKDELVFETENENLNEESFTDGAGSHHTIVTKKALYVNSHGEKFIVGVIRDVTDRKRADEMGSKLEAIVESSDDGIIGGLPDGTLTSWNSGAEKITGYRAQEIIGKPLAFLVSPERLDDCLEILQKVAKGHHIKNYENIYVCKDGRPVSVSVTISPVVDSRGKVTGVSAVFRDMTDIKRMEQLKNAQHAITRVLAESRTLAEATLRILQTICESLDWQMGALWRVDRLAGVLRCVEVWHVPGFAAPDFENTTRASSFLKGVGLPGRVWVSGEPAWIKDIVEDKNFPRFDMAKKEMLHSAFAFPIRLHDEVVGVLEFFNREIREPDPELLSMFNTVGSQIGQFMERKRAEETVLEKGIELARSNAEREQLELFAYVASHDLQEPLQKIISFGGMLREEKMDAKALQYVDRMQSAARRMGHLIEDLLKFSKVATKPEPYEKADFAEIVRDVMVDLELKISTTGARIEVGNLPKLTAQKNQIHLLFQNLISNAIKFQKKGVTPLIQITSLSLSDGASQIRVQDNGIGFDEKFTERIFKPFERLHSSEDYGGTGIGLAICQKIVARHKGSITAKSTIGKGTVFIITLPPDSSGRF